MDDTDKEKETGMDDTDKGKKNKTGRYCQDMGKLTPSHTDSRTIKWCSHLGKQSSAASNS